MPTYFLSLAVLAAVLVAHKIGLTGLYVTIPIYDVVMHIIGGVGIALLAAAILEMHFPGAKKRGRTIVISVIVVGIIWELFEVQYELTGHPFGTIPYYVDTLKDIIDDTLGALFVSFFITRKK